MEQQQQYQYGYELCDPTGGQGVLPLSPCSLREPYMRMHCGGCNPRCDVPFGPMLDRNQAIAPPRADTAALVQEVGGLALTVTGDPVEVSGLPPLIPLVTTDRRSVPADGSMCAVSLGCLFPYRRQAERVDVRRDIRSAVGLPPDAPLVLTGNAVDPVLEWIWANKARACEVIERNRFSYVVAPNFSVYGNKCPLEWAVNLRRSNLALAHFSGTTDNLVPIVATPNSFFEHRVCEWLSENRSVNCIALNTQMMRRQAEFDAQVAALQRLEAAVGRNLHFVVTGPCKRDRVEAVQRALRSVTIVSAFALNA